MVRIRLYVEGGGESKALRAECRRGFSEFLKKAGATGRTLKIIACGGRANAYDSFRIALSQSSSGTDSPMLLVDAEGTVIAAGPWEHLHDREGWTRPEGAGDGQCQLMVQCMEAWFLADRDSLATYFGRGFREAALPGGQHVESIAKADVLDGLVHASRDTSKGRYRKGEHSFRILALIDPTRVKSKAPHAARFLAAICDGRGP